MKFRLDASPDELEQKSGKLIESLSDLFRSVVPDLSESLEKALPPKEQELKYPVLRDLFKHTNELYKSHMQAMLKAINKVLDEGVQKSEGEEGSDLQKAYDHTKAPAIKDDRAYTRVKQVLMNLGYLETDFLEGGPLYGWSTNQLIDLAQDKRK